MKLFKTPLSFLNFLLRLDSYIKALSQGIAAKISTNAIP
jgi:hypothetical protein